MKYLILYLFLLISLGGCQGRLDKGSPAPEFNLKDVQEYTQNLAKYKGKVVLLHFWTDFCPSCKVEFPKIEAFYQDLKGKDFELLAINVGQPKATSLVFLDEFKASFPMLVDEKGITQKLYDIDVYPTNYFINPEGRIIRSIPGWTDKQQVQVIINQHKKK